MENKSGNTNYFPKIYVYIFLYYTSYTKRIRLFLRTIELALNTSLSLIKGRFAEPVYLKIPRFMYHPGEEPKNEPEIWILFFR